MKIAGIIAEYNPFHGGHAYQIEQTRKAGASHIVAVMSGNYVQRGEPAFLENTPGRRWRCTAARTSCWSCRCRGAAPERRISHARAFPSYTQWAVWSC